MHCLMFLHSTTGNTRLVARYAAGLIREAGHGCDLVDITRHPEAPDLTGVDLVGFACPTMYFRPTLTMERFVARLPNAGKEPRPAFQLATAGGDPGAHFALLAESLAYRGWLTIGAHFVPMVNNWPPHRALSARLPLASQLAEGLVRLAPARRAELSLVWPDVGEPDARHRDRLGAFVEKILARASTGDLTGLKAPTALWRGNRITYATGRLLTVDEMQKGTAIRIDPSRCSRCGTCVSLCPSGCLTARPAEIPLGNRAGDTGNAEDAVPAVGLTCTGCWTCHNHCPERAISGWGAPEGAGRYPGPSKATRDLFRCE